VKNSYEISLNISFPGGSQAAAAAAAWLCGHGAGCCFGRGKGGGCSCPRRPPRLEVLVQEAPTCDFQQIARYRKTSGRFKCPHILPCVSICIDYEALIVSVYLEHKNKF